MINFYFIIIIVHDNTLWHSVNVYAFNWIIYWPHHILFFSKCCQEPLVSSKNLDVLSTYAIRYRDMHNLPVFFATPSNGYIWCLNFWGLFVCQKGKENQHWSLLHIVDVKYPYF